MATKRKETLWIANNGSGYEFILGTKKPYTVSSAYGGGDFDVDSNGGHSVTDLCKNVLDRLAVGMRSMRPGQVRKVVGKIRIRTSR